MIKIKIYNYFFAPLARKNPNILDSNHPTGNGKTVFSNTYELEPIIYYFKRNRFYLRTKEERVVGKTKYRNRQKFVTRGYTNLDSEKLYFLELYF